MAVQLSFVDGNKASEPRLGRTFRANAFTSIQLILLPPFHFSSDLLCRLALRAFSFFLFFSSSYQFSSIDDRRKQSKEAVVWSRPSISLVLLSFLLPPLPPHSFVLTRLTMRHRIPHLWLFLAFAWSLLVGLASAAPAPVSSSTKTLYRRQENGSPITQTVVTQTVQTINTFVLSL